MGGEDEMAAACLLACYSRCIVNFLTLSHTEFVHRLVCVATSSTCFATHARRERTMATIFYVLIPADSSEPMLDLQLPVPATPEENIGCLTKTLTGHYSRVAPIGQAAVDSMRTQLLSKSDASTKAPDEAMLGMLAQSQTVDIVQLLPATAASGFFGVNMYVDDKGQAKQSPINVRASAVCTACGMPTEVRGDAFVAKVWDDQDGFVRHDLRVSDLASDAPWVLEAKQRNVLRANPAQLAEQMSQLKSMGQAAPKLPLAERLAAATSAKAAGPDLFTQGDVAGAVTKHSRWSGCAQDETVRPCAGSPSRRTKSRRNLLQARARWRSRSDSSCQSCRRRAIPSTVQADLVKLSRIYTIVIL